MQRIARRNGFCLPQLAEQFSTCRPNIWWEGLWYSCWKFILYIHRKQESVMKLIHCYEKLACWGVHTALVTWNMCWKWRSPCLNSRKAGGCCPGPTSAPSGQRRPLFLSTNRYRVLTRIWPANAAGCAAGALRQPHQWAAPCHLPALLNK